MKLTDLEPEFIAYVDAKHQQSVSTLAEAHGVAFLCPLGHGHMIDVWFRNRGVPDAAVPGPGRWDVSGTNIEDLTLSPSINLPGPGCGWHGWIKSGDVTSC